MTDLNADEMARWNNILEHASLQLIQVIIGHGERKTLKLGRFESSVRRSPEISQTEGIELMRYESQKQGPKMNKNLKRCGETISPLQIIPLRSRELDVQEAKPELRMLPFRIM